MTTPPPPPDAAPAAAPPHEPGGAAAEVLHSAEALVERAVVAAERSLLRRLGLRGLRLTLALLRGLGALALTAYFVFAVAILLTRYALLPHIDDWRPRIAAAASAALHAPVGIRAIEADWQGLHPRLILRGVTVSDADGHQALALDEVDAVLSWKTLLAGQPRLVSLAVQSPQIQVRRLADHRYDVAGFLIDPRAQQNDSAFLDWVLAQGRIRIIDAHVHFVDESAPAPAEDAAAAGAAPSYDFDAVNFLLTRGLTGHRFSLQLRPPAGLAGPLDLRGELHHAWGAPVARMSAWSGTLYAQVDDADLARLESIVHLLPQAARLARARGALRAWIDYADQQVTRLRADVALTGVDARWRADLDPMRMDHVQGRVTLSSSGDAQELALTGMSMDGPDGLRLPPTDLMLRTRRGSGAAPVEESRFEANRLVLADWSRLARQFPLPADWLGLIERTAAQGTLEDLRATWDGPQTPPRNYSLRARFSGLGFTLERPAAAAEAPAPLPAAPDAPAPGAAEAPAAAAGPAPDVFEHLAGSIDLTQDAGSLRVDSPGAVLRLPALFGERSLDFDALAGQLRWSRGEAGVVDLELDSLAASNPDLDLHASASLRRGGAEAPRLDLSGRVSRLRVAAVARYLPVVLPEATRDWLAGGLLDGTGSDGSFVLRGDPARFPFADGQSGEFHAAIQVHGGRLNFAPAPLAPAEAPVPAPAAEARPAPRWPELAAIEAGVQFDRDRMTIAARRARAYGFDLANVTVQLPHMAQPGQHLLIDGQGSGPLNELLRYAAASPINGYAGGWLGQTQSSGPARLSLKLDIPLAHAVETNVSGRLGFQGDSLQLRTDLAPFSGLSGALDFTQHGIRLSGITAGFLGGEVRVSGDTKADGTVLIQGAGTATPLGLRALPQLAPLGRVLELSRGQLRYSASVALQKDTTALQVDSDLLGLAVNLPLPLRKAAAETRPLHVELTPVPGALPARDALHVSLGSELDAQLQRVGKPEGGMRVERGVIALGGHANLPDSGLLLFVDQADLDVDRWQALLSPPGAASGAAPRPAPGAAAGDSAGFDQVVLRAHNLTLAGKNLSNVSLSARRDPSQVWLVDIDADQASGSARWSDGGPSGHGRLMARLAKLSFPERDQKQVNDLLAAPPTDLPELDIVADQFELGKHSLGRLELTAQSTGEAGNRVWNLQHLVLNNPDGRIVSSGTWQREGGGPARRMALKISVACSNAGGMLDRLGLGGYIKNGSGKLEGDLSWLGSPFSVDYASLSGNLHLNAEKGQVLKLDTGAGRLLAVFSLQSVWSLATGDLREFSAGVGFDALSANASIAHGVLSTEDFLMKGNSGAGRMKGSIDLLAQTQNLQIVVVPEVNAGAGAIAYAAFVNPAIGLGAFIGTYLFNKPLSAVLTKNFTVTGPWSNPQVSRGKGETRPPGAAAPPPDPALAPHS
jgi:uncharacterized protein (TIGR02099 family)